MTMPRSRSAFLATLFLCAVPWSSWNTCHCPAAESPEPKRKNVLFFVADDLNCDMGCYGHPTVRTPNIDRLAKRGTVFTRAYCQFPLCSPSRSSFLTGRRPNSTRVLSNPRGIPGKPRELEPHPHFRDAIPDTVTLPQLFKNAGYTAARVGKLYHYGVPTQIGTAGFDDPPSWDRTVNPIGRDKHEEAMIFSLKPGHYGGTLSWMASDGTDEEQTDGIAATEAVRLLEELRDKPFFLAVGFYRPHTPYVATKPYFEWYAKDRIPLPGLSDDDRSRQPAAAYLSALPEQDAMTDALRQEAIQAYWASISFMDAQVGRVLDALDRLGLADSTTLVLTSDHGYHLADHGLWQKMSLFEDSARVPLIIADPGSANRGESSDALCELVDLYPTLADCAGLACPESLEGVSLRPVLDDPKRSVKSAAYTQVERGRVFGYSVRTDRFRYIEWQGGEKGRQLYDMQADPEERLNLADDPQFANEVAALRSLLQAYAAPTGQ
jgi:arylsulfatase A-like enzyme